MIDHELERTNMVDCQLRTYDITSHAVLDAIAVIPREKFVDRSLAPIAYLDEDIALGVSTDNVPRYLMEPAQFARLLQIADIKSQDIVLDVGCATGYSTAVLARLCGSVVAVEQDKNLVDIATQNLINQQVDNAVVVESKLSQGYAAESPYDVIFVGGAIECEPVELLGQLKSGGKLVTVVGTGNAGQATIYYKNDQQTSSRSFFNCAVWTLPGFQSKPGFEF